MANDGGAAFPLRTAGGLREQDGMSLRDYFAGQALGGILAGGTLQFSSHETIQPGLGRC